jgi:hypothetical protein
MTHQIEVVWSGADGPHGLLPDKHAEIALDVDGTVMQGVKGTKGKRTFTLPTGASKVTLTAAFSAEFGPVGKVPAMTEVVLEASQKYTVEQNGTALVPESDPAFGVGSHPLVDTVSASGGAGATLIRIHTDFVDIGKFWFAYAEFASEYQAEHVSGTKLVPLGFTGGDPKIWFASIADQAIIPPNPDISCLVFYRPNNYAYTRIDQTHKMYGLNRYLLRATTDPTAREYKREKFMPDAKGKPHVWVRAGFEHAMVESRRAIVMLHPWPSQSNFGKATSNALPTLANAAIRLLWAKGEVAPGFNNVQLGRLGVSGYSAGGLSMWNAFANNLSRVSEIYAFDARGTSSNAARVARWFRAQPGACLRMTSGYNVATNSALEKTIEQTMGGKQENVTAVPASRNDYKKGANPLWDETVSNFPKEQENPGFWHQFAMIGAMGNPPLTSVPNFLQEFLMASDF